jgi:hypothetical protein
MSRYQKVVGVLHGWRSLSDLFCCIYISFFHKVITLPEKELEACVQ